MIKPSNPHRSSRVRRAVTAMTTVLMLQVSAFPAPAWARHGGDASTASSALSVLPVALSAAVPASMLVGGVMLSVVAVETMADGVVWVFERVSDGTRMSVRVASDAAAGALLLSGGVVVVTALSTGWVLVQAGKAVLFIPNELGAPLLHHERMHR